MKFVILTIIITCNALVTLCMEKEKLPLSDRVERKRQSYSKTKSQPHLENTQRNNVLPLDILKLLNALEQKNITLIEKIIINNPDLIHFKTNDENTILHLAIKNKCHEEPIKTIITYIEKFSDLETVLHLANKEERTPLMQAIYYGNSSAADILIEKGISYFETNKLNQNCLHIAAMGNDESFIKKIIEWQQKIKSDASMIESTDINGRTPLSFAVTKSHAKIKKLVTQTTLNKADTHNGWTPLHWSTYTEQSKTVEKLLTLKAAICPDKKGMYPMHIAVQKTSTKSLACLVALRKHAHNTEYSDHLNQTPIMHAAQQLNQPAFDYLKEKKANLLVTDKLGKNIIHYLVKKHSPNTLSFIADLMKNKDVIANNLIDAPDKMGRTPLFDSIDVFKHFELLILTYKVNITVVDKLLNSLLHVCAEKNKPYLIDFMLKQISNKEEFINWLNNDNQSAYDIAARYNHIKCMEILLLNGTHVRNDANQNSLQPLSIYLVTNDEHNPNKLVREKKITTDALENMQKPLFYLQTFASPSSSEEKEESEKKFSSSQENSPKKNNTNWFL